jgi:hypothetical protein
VGNILRDKMLSSNNSSTSVLASGMDQKSAKNGEIQSFDCVHFSINGSALVANSLGRGQEKHYDVRTRGSNPKFVDHNAPEATMKVLRLMHHALLPLKVQRRHRSNSKREAFTSL